MEKNTDKYTGIGVVITDERGNRTIIMPNTEPDGWYCECGEYNNYSQYSCRDCGIHRKR